MGSVMNDSSTHGEWFEHGEARIWYEVSGDPVGPPVLVLPGLFCSTDDLAEIRAQMAAKGMRVIAADLPGSGKSLPQPRHYTSDYYAQDAAALTALLESIGALPAVITGFSDGGEVALLLAATRPEMVKGVLTWGAVGSIVDESVPAFFRTLLDEPKPEVEGFRNWLVEKYSEEGARESLASVAEAFSGILANDGDIARSKASEIKAPVLLIAGDQDEIVPKEALVDLNAHIPNGRIMIVEGGGHGLHESHPQLMADTIHTFLFAYHLYPMEEKAGAKQ